MKNNLIVVKQFLSGWICSYLTNAIKLILVFTLTWSFSAFSEPISEKITYREFTDLVKHSVKKIPELQNLWNWQKRTGHHIYFGGGTLRGLLHWIHEELQDNSLEYVRKMRVPSIHKLQLQKGSDLDLFAPDNLIKNLKSALPEYANWDILGDSFHAGNVLLGGPTIEKIRVNPNYFDDPLDGLRHFYDGKLVYHWTPEDKFRNLYWVKERGNTKTTEALRFIRFAYNLPELEVDSESFGSITNIAEIEKSLITKSDGNNWWLNKGVKKLHTATGNNLPETLDALRKYNLLSLLGQHRYLIPGDYDLSKYVKALADRGFSVGEMKYAERVTVSTIDKSRSFMTAALSHVENPEEFIILANFHNSNPNDDYKKMVSNWVEKNLRKFFDLKPDINQAKRLAAQSSKYVPLNVAIMEGVKEKVTSPEEFLSLTKYDVVIPSPEYKEGVSSWIGKNMDLFFSLNPTLEDIVALKLQSVTTVDLDINIIQRGLYLVETPQQFLDLVEFEVEKPSDTYKREINKFIRGNIDAFLELNPSTEDIRTLLNQSVTSKDLQMSIAEKSVIYFNNIGIVDGLGLPWLMKRSIKSNTRRSLKDGCGEVLMAQ